MRAGASDQKLQNLSGVSVSPIEADSEIPQGQGPEELDQGGLDDEDADDEDLIDDPGVDEYLAGVRPKESSWNPRIILSEG